MPRTALAALAAALLMIAPAAGQPPKPVPAPPPRAAGGPVRQLSHTADVPAAAAASAVNEPRAIARPEAGKTRLPGAPAAETATSKSPLASKKPLLTVLASLAVVLGLFLLVVWFMRRSMPRAAQSLPSEVVEVLGFAKLGQRQQAQLIRLGNKLLLVSLSATGVEALAEVTDPVEVDRLAGLCRQSNPHSSTASFRHIFHQFGRDRAPGGFIEAPRTSVGSKPRGPAAGEAPGEVDLG